MRLLEEDNVKLKGKIQRMRANFKTGSSQWQKVYREKKVLMKKLVDLENDHARKASTDTCLVSDLHKVKTQVRLEIS